MRTLIIAGIILLLVGSTAAQDTTDPCKRYNCTGWEAPESDTSSEGSTTGTNSDTTDTTDDEFVPTYCLEESTKKARAYIVDVYDQFCDWSTPFWLHHLKFFITLAQVWLVFIEMVWKTQSTLTKTDFAQPPLRLMRTSTTT